jgi:hypothetical protein
MLIEPLPLRSKFRGITKPGSVEGSRPPSRGIVLESFQFGGQDGISVGGRWATSLLGRNSRMCSQACKSLHRIWPSQHLGFADGTLSAWKSWLRRGLSISIASTRVSLCLGEPSLGERGESDIVSLRLGDPHKPGEPNLQHPPFRSSPSVLTSVSLTKPTSPLPQSSCPRSGRHCPRRPLPMLDAIESPGDAQFGAKPMAGQESPSPIPREMR